MLAVAYASAVMVVIITAKAKTKTKAKVNSCERKKKKSNFKWNADFYAAQKGLMLFLCSPAECEHRILSACKWQSKKILELAPNVEKCCKNRSAVFFLQFYAKWCAMIKWHRNCLWFKCKYKIQKLCRNHFIPFYMFG